MKDYLWDPFDQIKIELLNHLLGHIGLIKKNLKSFARILYTSDK
jgi:hypothetical protein